MIKQTIKHSILIALLLLMNACVEENRNTTDKPKDTKDAEQSNGQITGNETSYSLKTLHSAGIGPSSQAFATTESKSLWCVHGVFEASIQSGGINLVKTGTLTQNESNPFTFYYESNIDDRLQINFSNETYLDCYIDVIQGNFSKEVLTFLGNAHSLKFRFVNSNGDELDITSERTSNYYDSFYTIKIVGSLSWNQLHMDVDLLLDGQGYFESSFGGSEKRSDDRLTGTITAEDIAISIDETLKYRLIVSGGKSASSNDRWINNSWNIGADSYLLTGYTHGSFKDGSPSQIDTEWRSTGELTLNNTIIGQMKLDFDQTYVYFNLQVDAELYEIQKFKLF